MGPSIACGDGVSEGLAKGILTGSLKSIDKRGNGFVDVRDVALAHLNAVKIEEAKNKRFIVSNESIWFRELG